MSVPNIGRTIIIPGLAMSAEEIPVYPGQIVLENPGIGRGVHWNRDYSLEEVAEFHLLQITEILKDTKTKWTLSGMSMGGMILAIIASEYRSQLPSQLNLRFYVTTANSQNNPAISDSLLATWMQARPGDTDSFAIALKDFFSEAFRNEHPSEARKFFHRRAMGENLQSPKEFFRQMNALRKCHADAYFSRISDDTALFIGGRDDYILGSEHNNELSALVPQATHIELPQVGHMINLERPDIFTMNDKQILELL